MILLDGLWWLLLLVGPLLFLQRRLHRETQAIFLLVTRRSEIALVLFSLLFFPGVLLHELSHYVMARLLGGRTGRLSLIPSPQKDGRLQLGYVETSATDFLRDALIGTAPLLTGGLFVAYAGLHRMDLTGLWTSLNIQGATLLDTLDRLHQIPDFWLWFYLTFTVSSTMMPSASDRRAWLPVTMVVGVLIAAVLVAGAGPWLLENVASPLNQALRAVAVVFGIGVGTHMVLLLPLWVLRQALTRLTGLQVV
ncbi:MAG: hypothetical protein EHM70_22025 [Chloroflexota bacterium]|nr:MAG: hypothetical protein EHM70_22025 [Chloroflexota bacterium]